MTQRRRLLVGRAAPRSAGLAVEEVGWMCAAPSPVAAKPDGASLEAWILSALRGTTAARVTRLAAGLGELGICRPVDLRVASDDILSRAGFNEPEKKALNAARAAAEIPAPVRLIPWDRTPVRPVRLAEVRVVCSSTEIVQVALYWTVSDPPRRVERRYPPEDFCGAITTHRLELPPGAYVSALRARFEVVPGAARAYAMRDPANDHRLVALDVKTDHRRRPWTVRARHPTQRDRVYGRRPLPVLLVDLKPDDPSWVLAGLDLRPGVAARVAGLGAAWTKRAPPDLLDWRTLDETADHQLPDCLDTTVHRDRNAYTGARIDASLADPWFRDHHQDDDVLVAIQSSHDAHFRGPFAEAFRIESPKHCLCATAVSVPTHVTAVPLPAALDTPSLSFRCRALGQSSVR